MKNNIFCQIFDKKDGILYTNNMLKQQLRDELKQSMIARNELKTSVLRMLLSAITYYEINKGGAGYEASDEDVLSVLQTQVKQRKDSIEHFEKAQRIDLSDKEKNELALLMVYVPKQLSEEEIRKFVHNTILEVHAVSQGDFGKVMSSLMPKVKGKADGNLVSKIVKDALTQ
jgi:uncharacterized protein YqeY